MILVFAAFAADPAYYHPDDVAKGSAVFGKVSESMGPAFDERQGRIGGLGDALSDLELGVALLGAAAPAGLRDWSDKTRRKVVGESMRLQRHVDLLQEDYSRVFEAAVARALPTVGKGLDVKQCGASGVMAMMGKSNCAGKNLNPALAAALDADPALAKELASIAAVEWPTFEAPKAAQELVPLTGAKVWISGGDIATAFIGERVKLKQEALEAELERLLPEEPTEADIAKAKALKDAYVAALGKDGEVFRAAVVAALGRLEKKGGPKEVGWCANPRALGGCPGDNVSKTVGEALLEDKKFAKDIAGISGAE